MASSKRTKKVIILFILLAVACVASHHFIASANRDKISGLERRYTLSSAVYEMHLASTALTRWMRFVAVTGGEFQYNAFWEEIILDRVGMSYAAFMENDASEAEIVLLTQFIERRNRMNEISRDVFRLRQQGYYQEALELAHAREITELGYPLSSIIDELLYLTHERTQMAVDNALIGASVFEVINLALVIMLALTALVGMLSDKLRKLFAVKLLCALYIALTAAYIYLSVSTSMFSDEVGYAHESKDLLTGVIYAVETGTETLTRLSRSFTVTGDYFDYAAYREELGRDMFGRALDTFISNRAPHNEVNILVELVARTMSLRQIEEQVIQLRIAGYVEQAIALSFGPEFAAIGIPTNALSEGLRDVVYNRTEEAVNASLVSYNRYRALSLMKLALLFIIGLAGVLVRHWQITKNRVPNEAMSVLSAPYVMRVIYAVKNASITSRLIASFSLMILIFVVYVSISWFFDAAIERLYRHSSEYMSTRVEYLLVYHQEFTELRRLISESFMNPVWLETANEGIWRSFETRISASVARMNYVAASYIASVRQDWLFPEMPEDSRIYTMNTIMENTESVYQIYRENFFLSGNMSLDHSYVPDYTGAAEIMLRMLRRISMVNQGIVEENISHYQQLSTRVTASTLGIAIAMALCLAYLMVKSFTDKINKIEINAEHVEQGDFDATFLNSESDEISAIFASLVKVFTGLIEEINDVTAENKRGNSSARINLDRFRGGYKETALAINMLLDAAEEMRGHKEKMEIAQENSQAKSRFLARMSHEIRTPISAVLGISEIELYKSKLPMETEEAFAKIYNSATTLLGIVNDILDLSKIEAGKMEIFNEPYEVAELISDIAQLNMTNMSGKNLSFVINVDEAVPSILVGDELRIRQVMNNMISNSYKYTDNGEVRLDICSKGTASGSSNIEIVIRDTGKGMNREQLDALFDEYTRFHLKEGHFVEGTGLGMPITFNLLELMNGTIKVESEVGKGTNVTINLPQQIGSFEPIGAEVAANLRNFNSNTYSNVKRMSFKPESMPYGRVLVVDDVDANIYVARGLLGLYQLDIETCESARQAIDKIKSGNEYDIIFMDQMMPEMNGTEAVAVLRQMDYSHPIVALTANALVGQAEEFIRNGFDGFLSKPIQTAHLNAMLHKFVKNKYFPLSTEDNAAVMGEVKESPVFTAETEGMEQYFNDFLNDSGIQNKLYRDFIASKSGAHNEILRAIENNDIKTAHLAAHSLKGIAGLIGENGLVSLSMKAEAALRENIVDMELIGALGFEVDRVVKKLRERLGESGDLPRLNLSLDKDAAKAVFDRLSELLDTKNADALEMVEELSQMPQTEVLTAQIEGFEFGAALLTLNTLRETLGV